MLCQPTIIMNALIIYSNKMPKTLELSVYTNVPTDLVRLVKLVNTTRLKLDFVVREITIGDIIFTTIDVKLPQWTKEEIVYGNDEIRTLVPRGLCFIMANNVHIYTLYGHPKFGDIKDGHAEFLPAGMTMEILNSTTTRVFRRKENGECAHWGAFSFNGQIYEVIGSKNVHMVLRTNQFEQDLALYSDQRYSFAIKMAKLIKSYDGSIALPYLISTGFVLCGEGCFLDSQHFVKYNCDTMFFFGVSGRRVTTSDSIVKISPYEIDDFVKSLGLMPVVETIISNNESQKNIEHHFESIENSEGAVVSCVDQNYSVVYMYKHKNHWYIAQRALREQMKKMASTTTILARFARLHIELDNKEAILDRFLKFNAWYRQGITKTEQTTFFENWVDMNERFNLLTPEQQNQYFQTHIKEEIAKGTLYVVYMIGLQGSGKSECAEMMVKILASNKIKAVHLEQDQFASNEKGAKNLYQEAIEKTMNDPTVIALFLAKGNHTIDIRQETHFTLSKCTRNVEKTFVVMTKDGNHRNGINLCIQRIINRKGHASLFADNAVSAVNAFATSWQGLTEEEISTAANNIIDLEIDQPKNEMIKSLCAGLTSFNPEWIKVTDENLEIFAAEIEQKNLAPKPVPVGGTNNAGKKRNKLV